MKIKALYSVAEIARLTGLTRFDVHRWIERENLLTVHIGRRLFLPLHVLRSAFPEVWESVVFINGQEGDT